MSHHHAHLPLLALLAAHEAGEHSVCLVVANSHAEDQVGDGEGCDVPANMIVRLVTQNNNKLTSSDEHVADNLPKHF